MAYCVGLLFISLSCFFLFTTVFLSFPFFCVSNKGSTKSVFRWWVGLLWRDDVVAKPFKSDPRLLRHLWSVWHARHRRLPDTRRRRGALHRSKQLARRLGRVRRRNLLKLHCEPITNTLLRLSHHCSPPRAGNGMAFLFSLSQPWQSIKFTRFYTASLN